MVRGWLRTPALLVGAAGFVVLAVQASAAVSTIENKALRVTLDADAGILTVLDKRCGALWRQAALEGLAPRFAAVTASRSSIGFRLECGWNAGATVGYDCRLQLVGDEPDLRLTAAAAPDLAMPGNSRFLAGFALAKGDMALAVADYSNGHLYAMDAEGIPCGWLDGDRLDLPVLGLCDLTTGAACAMILETPEDAIVETRLRAVGSRRLQVPSLQFRPAMGVFGYPRSVLFRFAPKGGYVAVAKAYRRYAARRGLLVTLASKAKRNPNVARLFGAPDVWGDASEAFASAAYAVGVRKMLIHGRSDAVEMRRINALGYVTSDYDNYTDVLPSGPGVPVDSSHDRVPESVTLRSDGTRMPAWLTFDKKTQYMKRCPALWTAAAAAVIPDVLKRSPYLGRFIDVTTAEALYECYDPAHRIDRRGKQKAGADLLAYVRSRGLVVGGEHGIWWGAPHQDYIEGMMSSYQFSWPAGHLIHPKTKQDGFTDPWGGKTPAWSEYATRGIGHETRIPLWELVFHDCVVSTWYWGDATDWLLEAAPETLPRKDLFNIVYGTMPMLWADAAGSWLRDRTAFLRTCRTACKVHEAVATSELVSHAWLTPDRAVQRSRFHNGVVATGNFGREPRTVEQAGRRWLLPENGYVVSGPGIQASSALEGGVAVLRVRQGEFRWVSRGSDGWVSFADGPGRRRILLEGRPLGPGTFDLSAAGVPSGSPCLVYSVDACGARVRLVAAVGPGRRAPELPWPGSYEALTGERARGCDLAVAAAPGVASATTQGAPLMDRVVVTNRGAGSAGRVTLRWYADAQLPERLLCSRVVPMGSASRIEVRCPVPTDRVAGVVDLVVSVASSTADLGPGDNSLSRAVRVSPRPDPAPWRMEVEADPGDLARTDAVLLLPMPDFAGEPGAVVVREILLNGAESRPVPAQLDPAGQGAEARAAFPAATLCFMAPGEWPAGARRRFAVTWSDRSAGRQTALAPWSGWVSPDARQVRTPAYSFDLTNGSPSALKVAGVIDSPVKASVIYSSAKTGWVTESGATLERRILSAGPVRALVLVRRSMDGGAWYRKLYTIYRSGYDVSVATNHGGCIPDRSYYSQSGKFTDSGGAQALIDGSGDDEGISGRTRNPVWYHVTGAGWSEAAVALGPVSGISYWDSSARGGLGFGPAGVPEHRVRYVFASRPTGAEWAAALAVEAAKPPTVTVTHAPRRADGTAK
ncbi:MAG: hypothetical protein NT029_16085 [Armatimonadetes bacterium]|nr:hypothetical protein [Armatimonadota bacterium]